MVSHIDSVQEWFAEEDNWTWEGRSNKRLEKLLPFQD